MNRLLLGVLLGALAACGDDDGTTADSGPPGPADSGPSDMSSDTDSGPPIDCDAPATECPEDAPLAGLPCEGTFTCPYEYPVGGGIEWSFTCRDGRFEEMLLCGGCAPLPSESCRTPFEGTLGGGVVEIGPVGTEAFRPFEDGERIRPEFGAQGLTMFFFRVRVDGEDLPGCVTVSASASLDGVPSAPSVYPVKLRCGQSLRVFTIYPTNPCEFRDYPVRFEVTVEGVGQTSGDLVLEGGMCPRGIEGDAGVPDAG